MIYLPVSNETLSRLLSGNADVGDIVEECAVSEISALLVIQRLPYLCNEPNLKFVIERMLDKFIRGGNAEIKGLGREAFFCTALKVFDVEDLQKGSELFSELNIALLSQEDVDKKEYLGIDGTWDFRFSSKHLDKLRGGSFQLENNNWGSGYLARPQSVVLNAVRGDIGDHLHVQGVAGSGKTYIIAPLVELLVSQGVKPESILVLAHKEMQLKQIRRRINLPIQTRTYGSLAAEIVPYDISKPWLNRLKKRRIGADDMPPTSYAEYFSIKSVGDISSENVVKACKSTVRAYCESDDIDIEVKHLPKYLSRYSDHEKETIVLYANQIWLSTIEPPSRNYNVLPVRDYHRIKMVALEGWCVSSNYSHILLEESHDLSMAMLQILDRSMQSVFSFGDDLQNLRGDPTRRTETVHRLSMNQSLRSGEEMNAIVNPIVCEHPVDIGDVYHGVAEHRTRVTYYNKRYIPDHSCTILTNNEWGMFEWVVRLSLEGRPFTLLGNLNDLNKFVLDCFELYNGRSLPRHGALINMRSWDDVMERLAEDSAVMKINKILSRGYDNKNWEQAKSLYTKSSSNVYVVGRMKDALNQDYDVVMLTPDVMDFAWKIREDNYKHSCIGLYIGTTRVRRELIAPQVLRDWIEDVS